MSLYHLSKIEEREMLPGFKAKFVHTSNETFAFWDIEKGAELPRHNHFHEQISIITEGRMQFTLEDETMILEPGQVVVIPSYAYHSAVALTPCKMTDVFNPVREEYKL